MKRKAFVFSAVLSLFYILCTSAAASEQVQLYNRGEKIALGHEIVRCGEELFISTQDLKKIGLEYEFAAEKKLGSQYPDEYKNVHTITSRDCLGVWAAADIAEEEKYTTVIVGKGTDLQLLNYPEIKSFADSVEPHEAFTYTKARGKESVGTSSGGGAGDWNIGYDKSFKYPNAYVYVGEECYISLSFIGQYLSHSYTAEGNRVELWTSNENYLTVEAAADLNDCADNGTEVSLCIARSAGETLADCDIIGRSACFVSDKKTVDNVLIEVPSDKAGDGNLYFVADFGEKYTLLYKRLDFSRYGKITAYAERETVDFTANISLPEAAAEDVGFTLYAKAGKTEKSVRACIKSGESGCAASIESLPAQSACTAWIIFDTNKYKSEYIYNDELHLRPGGKYKSDILADYKAKAAKKIVCTLSLPEGYDCGGGNVSVKLDLIQAGTEIVVSNKIKPGDDSAEVILNDSTRSVTVPLYFNLDSVKLQYIVTDGADGLVKCGYYNSRNTTDQKQRGEVLSQNETVAMSMLKCREIKLTVSRPWGYNNAGNLSGEVHVTRLGADKPEEIIYFDESNPLIKSGENKGIMNISVVENEPCRLEITKIAGDEHIYPEYRYINPLEPVWSDEYRTITVDTQDIKITLLACINITGTLLCDYDVPSLGAAAECEDFYGNTGNIDAAVSGNSFEIKIPEDVRNFRIYANTPQNVNSYYVGNGESTRERSKAEVFIYSENDIDGLEVKYDTYMPEYPIEIEINERYNFALIKNTGDLPLDGGDIYVAAYDRYNRLISIEKSRMTDSYSGVVDYSVDDYKTKYIRIMVWQKDGVKPLGRIFEFTVNEPYPNDVEGFTFTDITEGNKYYTAVMDMYARGICQGYEDGSFKPDGFVYRSEAALHWCRAMGYYYDKYDFSCRDVEQNNWAHSYIGICVNENIFDLENGNFRPMEYITVNETVQSAVRILGFGTENYIEKAHELNIADNIDLADGDRFITRGEYAQLIFNVMKNK